MKKLLPIGVAITLLLTNTVALANLANSNTKSTSSKRKPKVSVTKNHGENLSAEERLKAAEARAFEAEQRAQEAEATALDATRNAKLAQQEAAEAKAAARQASETLTQMQQILAGLEAAQKRLTPEPVTTGKINESRPVEVGAEKTNEVASAKQPDSAQKPAEGSVTSVSKLPVKIYGSLLVNASFSDGGSNNIDVPLFGQKQGTSIDQNHENFNMTARQTRLGMRYEGKIFNDAKLTGVFEFDLFGGKPAIPNGEQFDLFRLRLAYGRIDWKK